MNKIALGQYYPSGSVIHKLDGRMKIILSLLFIVCCFLCKNIFSFVFLLFGALTIVFLSEIPLGTILKGLKPILFILAFTFVINIFFTKGDGEPIVRLWRFTIYSEGIYNASFMAVRIIALIIGSTVFMSYTTTPIVLTDSIESLLSPLKKIKIPVHDFAMMMSIALRFIPLLSEETDKIMAAQQSRGTSFSSGSLIKRIKALIPILIPLLVSAFRRAEDLATAMECRCYHGGEGRTKMNTMKYGGSDFIALGLMILFGGAIIFINFAGIGYTM